MGRGVPDGLVCRARIALWVETYGVSLYQGQPAFHYDLTWGGGVLALWAPGRVRTSYYELSPLPSWLVTSPLVVTACGDTAAEDQDPESTGDMAPSGLKRLVGANLNQG